MGKTLFEKIWDTHVVRYIENDTAVLYIDRHYIHEVTSPQAFEGIEQRGLKIFRPKKITATTDHNVPTINQHLPINDEQSRNQVNQLEKNCAKHNIQLFGLRNENQGIVHVIGPELGLTLPGSTIVCGDSHTSTHGAFGAIAFGIGTSEIEQVFASQCIIQTKPKTLKIEVSGTLGKGVTAKDLILYIISKVSTSGATGYFIEYSGDTIRNFSMEERMTICNMSIEMGARGGLIAPDKKTVAYIESKKYAPIGVEFEIAKKSWEQLYSDTDAKFDREFYFNADDITPMISYGTNPGMAISVTENIPQSDSLSTSEKITFSNSLKYMNFFEGEKLTGKKIDYVFIGSCTNSRIEDLRSAANIIKGKKKSSHVIAWVVPGSKKIEQEAIAEGLDKVFTDAGFEFRQPGCSACLGMNEDKIPEGKYCVSTSNRNFEGRQGKGARTILASPIMAAMAAIKGEITDVRNYLN